MYLRPRSRRSSVVVACPTVPIPVPNGCDAIVSAEWRQVRQRSSSDRSPSGSLRPSARRSVIESCRPAAIAAM